MPALLPARAGPAGARRGGADPHHRPGGAPPGATNSRIAKHIFPGGYVPALSEMMAAVENEGLWQPDIEVWRFHCAEPLRHWHDRFMANIDRARALHGDRFCRIWRFYLVASELTFRLNRQCVFQIQLAHRRDAESLTRDYLYRLGPAQEPSASASASASAE